MPPSRFYDFVSNSPETLHMVTWVKSPWGIPASLREMIGSGVNTYKWINDRGEAHLVKYHWVPKAGARNLTAAQAAEIQGKDVGHATRDLYEAIERGDFPEWELHVQLMPDGEHAELSFDPLDDTKIWPEDQFPKRLVGRMVLDRNPANVFAETEQIAFGTGVLVDGMDFSDDKMLLGRTLSYSDTQRYRVGPNYLQLPINQGRAPVRTNQRDGQMARIDNSGENPHVNYEPSSMGGLIEAPKAAHDHRAPVSGECVTQPISRTCDDYAAAGERYRTLADWEREDLLSNISGDLKKCPENIALRMVWHLYHCDENYGTEIAKRAGIDLARALKLPPLPHHPGPRNDRTVRATEATNGSAGAKQPSGVGD